MLEPTLIVVAFAALITTAFASSVASEIPVKLTFVAFAALTVAAPKISTTPVAVSASTVTPTLVA